MEQLRAEEQNAILLRSLRTRRCRSGGHSQISEDAARKRVNRALEHLQRLLAGQGVRVSAASLATVLSSQAVQAGPHGLAVSVASVVLADASLPAGVLAGILPSLLMSKSLIITLAALGLGLVVVPVVLKSKSKPAAAAQAAESSLPGQQRPASVTKASEPRQSVAQTRSTAPRSSFPTLLGRVANLRPLTPAQIEAFVEQKNRNAESLLAAYRASTNRAYLAAAVTNFPGDPDVQYTIVATRFFPDVQRQWIDKYKASAPADALPWYFSALEYFKRGDVNRAIKDLDVASSRANFGAELAPTLNALEELHVSAGRAVDEARVVAFQTCARASPLPMRELARKFKRRAIVSGSRMTLSSGDLIAAGFALGGHLSAGSDSQTVLNQMVGLAIEKNSFNSSTPHNRIFRRPFQMCSRDREQQASLKEHAKH
jgi:hypothetical protein